MPFSSRIMKLKLLLLFKSVSYDVGCVRGADYSNVSCVSYELASVLQVTMLYVSWFKFVLQLSHDVACTIAPMNGPLSEKLGILYSLVYMFTGVYGAVGNHSKASSNKSLLPPDDSRPSFEGNKLLWKLATGLIDTPSELDSASKLLRDSDCADCQLMVSHASAVAAMLPREDGWRMRTAGG